jgi:predicted secreted protein
MEWTTGLAVYALIWWVVLFAVLPWGNQPIERNDIEKGQASSAPKRPRILIKLAANTVLSALIWLVYYWIVVADLVSFRDQ